MSIIFHPDGRIEIPTIADAIEWDNHRRNKVREKDFAEPPSKAEEKNLVEPPSVPEGESSSLSEEGRWMRAMERLEAGDRPPLAEFSKEAPLRDFEMKKLLRKHHKGPAHYWDRVVKVFEAEGFSKADVYMHKPDPKVSMHSAGRLLRLYGVPSSFLAGSSSAGIATSSKETA